MQCWASSCLPSCDSGAGSSCHPGEKRGAGWGNTPAAGEGEAALRVLRMCVYPMWILSRLSVYMRTCGIQQNRRDVGLEDKDSITSTRMCVGGIISIRNMFWWKKHLQIHTRLEGMPKKIALPDHRPQPPTPCPCSAPWPQVPAAHLDKQVQAALFVVGRDGRVRTCHCLTIDVGVHKQVLASWQVQAMLRRR